MEAQRDPFVLNTSQFSTPPPETLNAEPEILLRFNTSTTSEFDCQNHQCSFCKVYSPQSNMYTFKAHVSKKKKINKLPATIGNAN